MAEAVKMPDKRKKVEKMNAYILFIGAAANNKELILRFKAIKNLPGKSWTSLVS
jgi:hypothetical protein